MAAPEVVQSRANPLYKRLRALEDRGAATELLCLLEGPKLVLEALAAGVRVVEAAASPRAGRTPGAGSPSRRWPRGPAGADAGAARSCWRRSRRATTARGCSSSRGGPSFEEAAALRGTPLVLVAEGVQNPGNLGGLLRTAEAAGATGAYLTDGLRRPLLLEGAARLDGQRLPSPPRPWSAVDEALDRLRGARRARPRHGGRRRAAATTRPTCAARSPSWWAARAPGSRRGLPARADRAPARSPWRPPVESLNVGVAAALVLFEAARQRGFASGGARRRAMARPHDGHGLALPGAGTAGRARRTPGRAARRRAARRPHAAADASTSSSARRRSLGPGTPLRRAIEQDQLRSLILWGPPGSGKTTLAHVIRRRTQRPLRGAARRALRRQGGARGPAARPRTAGAARAGARSLFVDEIHRFNKAQQDAFLAHVESGDIVLIGATTENPSFEVNAALLSRSRVVVLKPLGDEPCSAILRRALADAERGLGALARRGRRRGARASWPRPRTATRARALNVLELAVATAAPDADGRRRVDLGRDARGLRAQGAALRPRRRGALQPHPRAPQVDAQLRRRRRRSTGSRACSRPARTRSTSRAGWCASPPRTSASPTRRRSSLAMAAQQAVHFVGLPGGRAGAGRARRLPRRRAQEQRASTSPTARRSQRRARDARRAGAAADPQRPDRPDEGPRLRHGLPLRPRRGGGRRRRWSACPTRLRGRRYYRPTDRGREKDVAERLEAARLIRERKKAPPSRG